MVVALASDRIDVSIDSFSGTWRRAATQMASALSYLYQIASALLWYEMNQYESSPQPTLPLLFLENRSPS